MNKEEYKFIFDKFKSIDNASNIPSELKNIMLLCNPTQQKANQYNMLKSKPQNTDNSKLT